MTQIDTIRALFQNFSASDILTITDIQIATKFPRASIRRVLSSLSTNEEITRLQQGVFTTSTEGVSVLDEEEFHRKFIGTGKSGSSSRQFFAVTFEANDIDRENELVERLIEFVNENFLDIAGTTGYADDTIDTRDIDLNFTYPSIQVGVL